jgi:epoxyqueuosine reductase QueG
MNAEALTLAVKNLALAEGADLVGVAPVSRYDGAPRMLKPQAHLPEAKSVVVMAVHHPDASVEWGGEPNSNYPGPFQIGMIPKLDTICLRVSRFLDRQGHDTIPMPCTFYWRHRTHKDVPYCHAASFSHMNAFVAAGLGEYGWHGMVMSPKYGPRQRIISLVTAAELTPDPLYNGDPLCDRCGQCEKACWGNNYEKRHLFSPETISFQIEGKTFEYANINRWRCFWGEQCHLDMQRLAEEENLTEQSIYDAMDKGVPRIAEGNAGYMCASFKYCMGKPVRRWEREVSPGPRRQKPELELSGKELMAGIVERAKFVGADRIAVQPLSAFAQIKGDLYEGFRTEKMFETFDHVITIGRMVPALPGQDEALTNKSRWSAHSMTTGQLMMGSMDIARFLDDNGCEAMQVWGQVKASPIAALLAGWEAPEYGRLVCQSVICRAPLPEQVRELSLPLAGLEIADLFGSVRDRLKHCDLMGVARLDELDSPVAESLRRLAPGARSLVVLAQGMPKRVVELAGQQEAECAMSFQYVSYQAMRETFWAAEELAGWLADQGHDAVPLVDLAPDSVSRPAPYIVTLPDLRAQAPFAAATGLGSIGKHGFLLTPEFGPRQRLAFVLTTAELPTTAQRADLPSCPEGCTACADACPVQALANEGEVFARQETRCEWARSLGMTEDAGTGLLGWRIPDLPVPDSLTDEDRQAALAQKDPIQTRCYTRANHSDTTIERCLQACPL